LSRKDILLIDSFLSISAGDADDEKTNQKKSKKDKMEKRCVELTHSSGLQVITWFHGDDIKKKKITFLYIFNITYKE
jgi:hypothetical protein